MPQVMRDAANVVHMVLSLQPGDADASAPNPITRGRKYPLSPDQLAALPVEQSPRRLNEITASGNLQPRFGGAVGPS